MAITKLGVKDGRLIIGFSSEIEKGTLEFGPNKLIVDTLPNRIEITSRNGGFVLEGINEKPSYINVKKKEKDSKVKKE